MLSTRRPIIAFDFETSSLLEDGGQPVEAAFILADPVTLEPVGQPFHAFMYLEPGETMAPEALETHGYSPDWLRAVGCSRAQALEGFAAWLEPHGLHLPRTADSPKDWRRAVLPLGQNIVRFDLPVFERWAGPDAVQLFHYRALDTMNAAQLISDALMFAFGYNANPFWDEETGLPSASLVAQARYFGLDVSHAHGALWDAQTALFLYRQHLHGLARDFKFSNSYQEHLRARGLPV